MNQENPNKEKCANRVLVVVKQTFAHLALWFTKLMGGIMAASRWLFDKACAAINQYKEKKMNKRKLVSESCGQKLSAGETLSPLCVTEAQQSQKEDVNTVSTTNETSEKTERPEDVSAPHLSGSEAPNEESKEKKKPQKASVKVKKSVPARMAKITAASVAKATPTSVERSPSVPMDEPKSLAPDTVQVAESDSGEQVVNEHGPCHVKVPTHGLRLKKNRSNLYEGAHGQPLRKYSLSAEANASDAMPSTLSPLRERLDFDTVCFLGFGVGMAIIGCGLGYVTLRLFLEYKERSLLFMETGHFISLFVASLMLIWALYLGILANGKRGFLKTFNGWLVTIIIAIIIFTCIGQSRYHDVEETRKELKRQLPLSKEFKELLNRQDGL